jgi:hypothetical protein
MSDDEKSPTKSHLRRAGHRRSEVIIDLKKRTAFGALFFGLGMLALTYAWGHHEGHEQALNTDWDQRLRLVAAESHATLIAPQTQEGILIIQAGPEADVTVEKKITDSSSISAVTASVVGRSPRRVLQIMAETPAGLFGIQLGAFQSHREAMVFVRAHEKHLLNLPVVLTTVSIKNRGQWTRVRVGAQRTRAMAMQLRDQMSKSLTRGSIVIQYR